MFVGCAGDLQEQGEHPGVEQLLEEQRAGEGARCQRGSDIYRLYKYFKTMYTGCTSTFKLYLQAVKVLLSHIYRLYKYY